MLTTDTVVVEDMKLLQLWTVIMPNTEAFTAVTIKERSLIQPKPGNCYNMIVIMLNTLKTVMLNTGPVAAEDRTVFQLCTLLFQLKIEHSHNKCFWSCPH